MWSKMYIGPLVKYPLSLFNFTETWIFWSIGKTLKNQFFLRKSIKVESSCSMRTGMKNLVDAFRNFADISKN
jgi:hypothetical protein